MTTHCETWFNVKIVETWMHAHDTYAHVYSYVIVCVSARKTAPVNLLMCPFELCMFIGVSMQLRVVFKYDFLVLIPYCWSVALEKKNVLALKHIVVNMGPNQLSRSRRELGHWSFSNELIDQKYFCVLSTFSSTIKQLAD